MAQFPLIDQASLVMIPGAYKEGKIYSQLPTDGSGDFTYTRGTDTATRVNEAGNIEKEYENTLLQSNNWAQSDSQYEITGGEAGYDGTNDAWLVNKLAAAYFSKDALVLTGVQTISFFAKAGSLDRIFVFIGGDAARFDLTNGTAVSAGGNPVSQNIELVSGTTDWYRCSIVLNKTSTQNLLIKPQNSSNQDVTGTIYIQDAQLNQGLVAYPYIETTTVPVYAGLTDNMPRLDYTDATCPSLLLEPSRTNLIKYSEYYEVWSNSDITFTTNTSETSSPEGLYNSTKIDVGSYASLFYGGISVNASTQYTFSFYAKKGTINTPKLAVYDESNGAFISVDIAYTIGTDEWTRIEHTFTTPSGCNSARVYPLRGAATGSAYLFGAQLEQGSYPTSYIPNHSGGTITRGADFCNGAGDASTFNDSEGVLYAEVKTSAPVTSAANSLMLSINDNTNFNEVRFEFFTSNRLYASVRGADGEANTVQTITQTNYNKIAIKYTSSGSKLFVNGVGYAFGGKSISGLNAFSFSRGNTTTSPFYGDVKQVLVFSKALTDTECIALTTL